MVVPDSPKVENQEIKREIDQSKSNKVNWNVLQKSQSFLKSDVLLSISL